VVLEKWEDVDYLWFFDSSWEVLDSVEEMLGSLAAFD
jgi:hypothetical protein